MIIGHSKKRLRLHLVLPLVILAIAIGVVAYRFLATAAEAPNDIVLLGNIDVRQVNLAFKVGGRIDSMSVDEGDAVVAGQQIAALESAYFEDELRLVQAQCDQAQAQLERLKNGSRPEEIRQAVEQEATAQAAMVRAEKDYARAQQLIKQNAIAKQEYDAIHATFLEAQAALKSAQASRELIVIGPRKEDIAAGQAQFNAARAQLQITQRRLKDAVLLAPHDGVILTRAREVGAIVTAGETVVTLTLSSPLWVRTYVGEPDLGNVQPGMPVQVATDTPGGRLYAGKVGYISPTAEFTPKTVETRQLRTSLVYRVRIVVLDPDGSLRQGMPVSVTLNLPGSRPRTFGDRVLEAMGLDGLL